MPVVNDTRGHRSVFPLVSFLWQIVIIVLFAVTTDFADYKSHSAGQFSLENYSTFQDVHVMLVVGFGLLFSFLTKYTYSGIGLTFMLTGLTIQWALLMNAYWREAFDVGKDWHRVELDINSLLAADFTTITVVISFGVFLGRVSPIQGFFIMLMEVMLASLNQRIAEKDMNVVEYGGAMFVHTFGAFFGLAVSGALGNKRVDAKSNRSSNTFALVGTLFLWVYWPSFNAAYTGDLAHRAIVNTVLALTASCVSAFYASAMVSNARFDVHAIQRATLAGGVAVGSAAILVHKPYASLILGFIAGPLSVVGAYKIQPKLKANDTCGVFALHGLPGLLGSISGIIVAGSANWEEGGVHIGRIFPARDPNNEGWDEETQGEHQTYALLMTISIALIGGAITGLVVRVSGNLSNDIGADVDFFDSYEEEAPDTVLPELLPSSKESISSFEVEGVTVSSI